MSEPVIAINQRIPLHALEASLLAFLKGEYDASLAREQLQISFSGENRLRKGVRQMGKIVERSPLTPYVQAVADALPNALKSRTDRNLILTALLTAAYPFAFDTLRTFGKYFQVQSQVSTATIRKNLATRYGGHRATENALSSVVAMLLEAELFIRIKPGLFERIQPQSVGAITQDLFYQSYRLNHILKEKVVIRPEDPYFFFMQE